MERKTTQNTPLEAPANNANLPAVPAAVNERDLTAVAGVFAMSGYWPDKTAAQLATLIVIGESLGLDAGQSVIDLEICPGDANKGPTIVYAKNRTYEAARDRIDAQRAAMREISDNKDDRGDRVTSEPATLEAAPGPPSSNVVLLRSSDNAAGDVAGLDAGSDAIGAEAGDPDTQDPAERGFWRASIIAMLRELAKPHNAINERLDRFDAAGRDDRQKMLIDCQKYYEKRTGDLRHSVVQRLGEDGKKTPEQQTGFYLYADVPTDPAEWTFTDASKAAAALDGFLKRK